MPTSRNIYGNGALVVLTTCKKGEQQIFATKIHVVSYKYKIRRFYDQVDSFSVNKVHKLSRKIFVESSVLGNLHAEFGGGFMILRALSCLCVAYQPYYSDLFIKSCFYVIRVAG